MAYCAFADIGAAAAGEAPVRVAPPLPAPRLSALEWSVVAIARGDRLSSLRAPGRMALAMATLFGAWRDPRLADPRLEALRRIAVLSWHYGYTVPSQAIAAFIAAGFTPAQYELVVDSIDLGRRRRQQERAHG